MGPFSNFESKRLSAFLLDHKSDGLSVPSDTFQAMENLQGFEGLSALEESIVRLHEVFNSLLAGGFTEDQALTFIVKMTRSESDS